MKLRWLLIPLLVTVTGCSSQAGIDITPFLARPHKPVRTVRFTHNNVGAMVQDDSATSAEVIAANKELDAALTQGIIGCQSVLSTYAQQAKFLGMTRVTIATVGAIAGASVPVVGLMGGATMTVLMGALGGISGLANFEQQALTDQGFTAGAVLTVRSGIQQSVAMQVDRYTNECATKFDPGIDYNGWWQCKSGCVSGIQAACIAYAIQDPTVKVVSPGL